MDNLFIDGQTSATWIRNLTRIPFKQGFSLVVEEILVYGLVNLFELRSGERHRMSKLQGTGNQQAGLPHA